MSNTIVPINDVRSKIDFKKPINYMNHRAIYDNANLLRAWKLYELLANNYVDNTGYHTVCGDDASWHELDATDLKNKFDYTKNKFFKITIDKIEVIAGNTNSVTVMLENFVWLENKTFNTHPDMVNGGNGLRFTNDTTNRIFYMTTYDADDGMSDQKLEFRFFYDTEGQFTDIQVWQYGTDNTGDSAWLDLYVTVEAIRTDAELPSLQEINDFIARVDAIGAQNIPGLSDLWE